jgi:hypothetical protein
MEKPINKIQKITIAMSAGVILDLIVASIPDGCADDSGERSIIYN